MTRTFPTLIAALALSLGAAAQAQTPTAGQQAATPAQTASAPIHGHRHAEHRHSPRMDPAKRQQQHAQRLADFKRKLKLTAAQQGAWDQYQAALKPPARPDRPNEARQAERERAAQLTTPQRIDAMQQRQAEMAARMKARGDATKAFYAQLNAEQQQVFDAETARRAPRAAGHGPRGHGHPGQHRGDAKGKPHAKGQAPAGKPASAPAP